MTAFTAVLKDISTKLSTVSHLLDMAELLASGPVDGVAVLAVTEKEEAKQLSRLVIQWGEKARIANDFMEFDRSAQQTIDGFSSDQVHGNMKSALSMMSAVQVDYNTIFC